MRTILLFLVTCLISFSVFSQTRLKEITHYLFPEFTKGTVLLKNGNKQETLLNYNALTEEMIFNNNGKKLAIGPVEQVDTILVSGRKFIPLEGKFVEIIYHNKLEIYASHKCSIVDPGKPAAYGGTSQTSSTTIISSYMSGGQMYEMELPDGIQTKAFTEYWLKKDGKPVMFVSLRQLSKQFGDKTELFKKFVKENKVDYDNQESMIALVKFMEQQ